MNKVNFLSRKKNLASKRPRIMLRIEKLIIFMPIKSVVKKSFNPPKRTAQKKVRFPLLYRLKKITKIIGRSGLTEKKIKTGGYIIHKNNSKNEARPKTTLIMGAIDCTVQNQVNKIRLTSGLKSKTQILPNSK